LLAPPRMPTLTARERVGTVIDGKYAIEGVIARGGMGVVFAATHRWTDRRVAVKLVLDHDVDAQHQARLVEEARLATRLDHPNVVQVLDMGATDDGALYLVMERLSGRTLRDELREAAPLEPAAALRVLLPVFGAIATAHDHGIVHRDLKPANILLSVSSSDGPVIPKVLDFGIAKLIDDSGFTKPGSVVGTPAYLSPEQAAGHAAGPTADVWGLGVLLFECLSGRVPFEGDGPSVLQRLVNGNAPLLRSVTQRVPQSLAAAIDRALQREPNGRYADVRSFARALLATAVSAGVTLPDDPDPVGLPQWRRWWTEEQHAANVQTQDLLPSSVALEPLALKRRWTGALAALVAVSALGVLFAQQLVVPDSARPREPSTTPVPVAGSAPHAAPARSLVVGVPPAANALSTTMLAPAIDAAVLPDAAPHLPDTQRSRPRRRQPAHTSSNPQTGTEMIPTW
jgi:serine/threonine protein kinase